VAELIAKSPLDGKSETIGALTLAEKPLACITSVSPLRGQEKPLSAALRAMGLRFPAPNQTSAKGPLRLLWTGRDQAFLIGGDAEPLGACAALTDQSDGWACLALTGPQAAEALIRLVPLDLGQMAPGTCARAPLGHMAAILVRTPDGFELWVFRSMAQTAWHEVTVAMKSLAARAVLRC